VIFLDCHDQRTALTTLSGIVGVAPDRLSGAIRGFDDAALDHCDEDPAIVMPREVLESLGVDIASTCFAGAHYFHGTRTTDPDAFQRCGILPLDAAIEQIWTTLHDLVRGECSPVQWEEFRQSVERDAGGHDGFLYRLKTRDQLHHGPHAVLVRDILLDASAHGGHDYLKCPEIVQDIARCYRSASGVDLETRFRAASVPCIVTFRLTRIDPARAIAAACWYLHGDGRANVTMNGFIGEGSGVPAEDVLAVEVAPGSSSRPAR